MCAAGQVRCDRCARSNAMCCKLGKATQLVVVQHAAACGRAGSAVQTCPTGALLLSCAIHLT